MENLGKWKSSSLWRERMGLLLKPRKEGRKGLSGLQLPSSTSCRPAASSPSFPPLVSLPPEPLHPERDRELSKVHAVPHCLTLPVTGSHRLTPELG